MQDTGGDGFSVVLYQVATDARGEVEVEMRAKRLRDSSLYQSRSMWSNTHTALFETALDNCSISISWLCQFVTEHSEHNPVTCIPVATLVTPEGARVVIPLISSTFMAL